ncbi:MAG TPA: inositol monophosphatase family protein [Alphaproteobacteria bacterium]|nr:inositol monophosphatase family protein [Alphaproteobacteria bacterium]
MIDVDTISRIVRRVAEDEILPRYRALGKDEVRQKSGPMDLVTAADIAAERALAQHLLREFPDTLVVGEEAATEDPSLLDVISKETPVWLLDPIDGTLNFAHGRRGFGIIVAYLVAGKTIAGWIHDPLENVTVTAVKGGGAWCGVERMRVSDAAPLSQMIGAAYGEFSGGVPAGDILMRSGQVGALRNAMCGAVDYIEIARQQKQFFLSPRSLPWDHAAGVLIMTEAGGVARFLDGAEYDTAIPDRQILAATDEPSWRALQALLLPAARGPRRDQ